MNNTTQQIMNFKESLQYIQEQFGSDIPNCTLVLGSGLKDVVHAFKIEKTISYADIPHFPKSHVQGHSGQLHLGTIKNKSVLIFSGRFHHYQGIPNSISAIPGWISGFWKIPLMISTNATGGICTSFKMGDIALIKDHIFLQSDNPLLGVSLPEWENPFCDLTSAYDTEMRTSLLATAKNLGIELKQGVYMCITGPSYETPAEIEMFRKMGADMVGMSTVPEVIVARKMGVKTLGISMIANMAAGMIQGEVITHHDVIASIQKTQGKLSKLLSHWLSEQSSLQ